MSMKSEGRVMANAGSIETSGDTSSAIAQPHRPKAAGQLTVESYQDGPVIKRDVFGQFAEHLGQGIYGGIWVGPDSKIPNVRGIRSDVVDALRAIRVPVVRWPGGCFADKYHWRDGIGAQEKRPARLNSIWGGAVEPNSFGTHEFMDFLEQIGAEAYVSVNIGSGSVAESSDWLEYMTAVQPTALALERAANGHPEPYKIKYIGMGNEMWGCGGAMSPAAYIDHLKQFVMNVDSQHPDQINLGLMQRSPQAAHRIAVGDGGLGDDYTEAVMKEWAARSPWFWSIEGLSMHHYTWGESMLNALAMDFGEKEYAGLIKETFDMETLIARRSAIMDKYDPKKQVSLVVDEWGVWLKPLPGLHPMFLKQQNSLRDAIAASLNIHIFARHADRVRMTNIAQMINVLQGMVLTEDEKILLTPTYYIFRMYVPFQDAQFIPVSLDAGEYTFDNITLPQIDVIAARATDGRIWVAATNLNPHNGADIPVIVQGLSVRLASGEVLSAGQFDYVNSFDVPDIVVPKPVRFDGAGGRLVLHLPPKSVTVVCLEA